MHTKNKKTDSYSLELLGLTFLFSDEHVDIKNLAYLMDQLAYKLHVTDENNTTDHCHRKFRVNVMPKIWL